MKVGHSLPPKEDIDLFEKLGNPGWNWTSYEHYIKKATTFTHPPTSTPPFSFDKANHGTDGALQTVLPSVITESLEMPFQKALIDLGVPTLDDAYGGEVCILFLHFVVYSLFQGHGLTHCPHDDGSYHLHPLL